MAAHADVRHIRRDVPVGGDCHVNSLVNHEVAGRTFADVVEVQDEGEVFIPEGDALAHSGPMIGGAGEQADTCNAGRIMVDHREQSVSGLLNLDRFVHLPCDMNRFSEAWRGKSEVNRDHGVNSAASMTIPGDRSE